MILAGDIGGTKCNLGLFRQEGSALRAIFQRRLATRDYAGLDELIEDFLQQAAAAHHIENTNAPSIAAAGFGVAGAVVEGRHYSENLPWLVDCATLTRKLKLKNICLLNDLTATALSLARLAPADFVVLNSGTPVPHATRAVIAAGTGLGAAILFWDGAKYRVAPSEAGQADFAPRTEREIQLLSYWRARLPHFSCEDFVSGRGFRRIHEFLNPAIVHASFESPHMNAAGEITERAMAESCAVCVETLGFWAEIFGALTGNFALQTMALGGIYVAGGIPVKILPKLRDGAFFRSFCGAGKLQPVLERIPISVVVNEDAPVWGAAYEALSNEAERQPR